MRSKASRFGVGLDEEAKRKAIVSAAVRVFGRHGYHAASVEQILSEANLSRRTFYAYFTSKEAVLHEALTELGEQFRRIGRTVYPASVEAAEFDGLVRQGAELIVSVVVEHRDILRVILEGLSMADDVLHPAAKSLLGSSQTLLEDFLTGALKRGLIRTVNVRVVAELVMDVNLGITRRYLQDGDERAVYRTVEAFLSIMRSGLMSNPAV